MVSVKKSTIFSSVFFCKIGLEIIWSYSLEMKEGFEDDKNVNFWKSEKWVFSKGVNPWFRVKNSTIFSILFFSKIGLEIVLSYGVERKEAFEDDKNVNLLKCIKWVFSKGVNPWFRSKNPQFFLVCFLAK